MNRFLVLAFLASLPATAIAQTPPAHGALAEQLRKLDANVIIQGTVRQPPLASMLSRDVEARMRAANRADRFAWKDVKTLADWERIRDASLKALRESLGAFPPAPKEISVKVTGSFEGDGYHVDKLVFQTRPGVVVTANLYRPTKPAESMPAMLLCLSHQSSKHTAHRQDMGMTWARAGCLVLVPDHIGQGERRQHPFGEEGPHDYHFRYDSGVQLNLVGDSLMGWFVWDLMRSLDVLLAQKGADAKRVILLSEPAGGGDVAGVFAALEPRITAAMVQNFGGPEPENPYPLTRDAEDTFDLAGPGTWESTRNLHHSAKDGFLPWAIVASIAPRKLIYFHEFYWDKDHDPVWKRLQHVYKLYNSSDNLFGLSGKGFVVGSNPENSHWLAINRETLYPVFERWFGIPNPKTEYSKRRPLEDFVCLPPNLDPPFAAQPLHALASRIGAERTALARKTRDALTTNERRVQLRKDWARLLGDVTPAVDPVVKGWIEPGQKLGPVTVERIHLGTEPGIVVPMLLLLPPEKGVKHPVVVGVAQQGKQKFLQTHADAIAELLSAGVAVCLPDVRGTGETSPSAGRDRVSASSSIAASELMLGQTTLAGQLRDLRSTLRHLRSHPQIDGKRIALWGESFGTINPPTTNFKTPHNASVRPIPPEPLGGLLALLGALYEDDIHAVAIHRGLSDFQTVLESSFCYLPYDVVVPGVLTVGDLSDVAAALTPRPLRFAEMVDGMNRVVAGDELGRRYEQTRNRYAADNAKEQLQLDADAGRTSQWLIQQLLKK